MVSVFLKLDYRVLLIPDSLALWQSKRPLNSTDDWKVTVPGWVKMYAYPCISLSRGNGQWPCSRPQRCSHWKIMTDNVNDSNLRLLMEQIFLTERPVLTPCRGFLRKWRRVRPTTPWLQLVCPEGLLASSTDYEEQSGEFPAQEFEKEAECVRRLKKNCRRHKRKTRIWHTLVVTSKADDVPPVALIQLTIRCRWASRVYKINILTLEPVTTINSLTEEQRNYDLDYNTNCHVHMLSYPNIHRWRKQD